MSKLREEIEAVINRNSAENGSNTPDFILAEYLVDCLSAFDKAVKRRSRWYGLSSLEEKRRVCLTGERHLKT